MAIGIGLGTALAGGASAIGGLISSIFGKKSNDSANQTNLKIAQMNNEWSEKMMDKQNMYNIAQWNREAAFSKQQAADANAFTEYMQDKANQYNSASAQAARLREAGLNPALVMSGQNAGTAQGASGVQASTPSGNSVGLPSPSQVTFRPYDYSGFGQAITQAIGTALQFQMQQSQVKNQQLQNQFLYESMRDRLNQEFEKHRSMKYDTDYRQSMESTRASLENEQYLSTLTNRLIAEETKDLVVQQKIYQTLVNRNLPDKLAMELAVMASQRDLNQFNSSINVGKFMDEIKKRGIKLSDKWEKIIFGALLGLSVMRK